MFDNKINITNRLPVGLLKFSNIITSNMIYVDKTDLIFNIASQRSPIFFSRPRRFGKTLLINTLASLFAEGIKYFSGLDIEKKWMEKTYPVIQLDFGSMAENNSQELKEELGEEIIRKFKMQDVISQIGASGIKSTHKILDEICEKIDDNSVVLLIDEYDAPLTHHIDEHDELKSIMKILNNFYGKIKQYTDKFRLIFITGVTRASHVSIFSAFNNLVDISLKKEFNHILGFTKDDLKKYFDPYVINAAKILQTSKDDIYQRLEQYYDGYKFALDGKDTVYNPWSVLNFFKFPEDGFKNYWFDSAGSATIINQYIKIKDNFDFLDYSRDDVDIEINEISKKYEITNIPINILLYQTGYLTIRDSSGRTANLVVPNTEVEESLLMLYLEENDLLPSHKLNKKIKMITNYIDEKNLPALINIFNSILNECVSPISNIFNDERSVRDIIYAALIPIPTLQKIKEHVTVKGQSDLEIITKNTCMIIEFKRTYPNRGPEASLAKAIEQIKNNRYGLIFSETYKIYRVAMVISTKEKKILKNFSKEVL